MTAVLVQSPRDRCHAITDTSVASAAHDAESHGPSPTSARLSRARQLLEAGNVSVMEAWLGVGYAHSSHFASSRQRVPG